MAMRDLIPWNRQESRAPALFRESQAAPLTSLRREMDRLFDEFFRTPMFGTLAEPSVWPSLELSQTENEVKVTAELPGMNERDVELFVDEGMLTIRASGRARPRRRAIRSASTAASRAGSRFRAQSTRKIARRRSGTAF